MPPTFNKLRNIESQVFSKEASSFTKEQLTNLKNELMETYAEANNYPMFRDKWNNVDARLSDLLKNIPPKNEAFYSLFLKHPIISGIILMALGAYLSPCTEDKEPTSKEDMSNTSINEISSKQ